MKTLLLKIKSYIEDSETIMDDEYLCRSTEVLIIGKALPPVYYELLEKIEELK